MHKNVLAALTADEAVAFGVVEPLHCSLFCHIDTCVPLIDLRWRDSEVQKAGYWLIGQELLTTDSVKRSLNLTRPKNDWQTQLDSYYGITILWQALTFRGILDLPVQRIFLSDEKLVPSGEWPWNVSL